MQNLSQFFLAQVDRDALVNQPFDYKTNLDYTVLKKADYLVLMQYKLSKAAYQPTLAGFLSYSQSAQRMQWAFPEYFQTQKSRLPEFPEPRLCA